MNWRESRHRALLTSLSCTILALRWQCAQAAPACSNDYMKIVLAGGLAPDGVELTFLVCVPSDLSLKQCVREIFITVQILESDIYEYHHCVW